jgi:two-component system CheB/CheR fusion protein
MSASAPKKRKPAFNDQRSSPAPAPRAGTDGWTNDAEVLAQLCEQASDALLVVDSQLRLHHVNRAAVGLTGLSPATLLKRSLPDVLPEVGGLKVADWLRRNGKQKQSRPRRAKLSVRHDAGRPVEASSAALRRNGKVWHLVSIRVRYGNPAGERELKADNRRLEQDASKLEHTVTERSRLLKLLHDVTAHCHRAAYFDEALTDVLREFCRFDGWSFGHVFRPAPDRSRLHAVDVCYEEVTGRFQAFRQATRNLTLRKGQSLPGRVWSKSRPEYVSIDRFRTDLRSRGALALVLGIQTAAAFPVELNGQVLAVLEFFSDQRLRPNRRILEAMSTIGAQLAIVEQRTHSEALLRRSEARLRRLVDSNIAGVFIASHDGRVFEANPALLDMLGYTRRDLELGRLNWLRQTPPEYGRVDREILEALRLRRVSEPREKAFLRKDHATVPVVVGMAALDPEDEPSELIAFVINLADLRQLEQQILEISDYEKQQLGQELHDGLSQQISGIKFQTDSLARRLREQEHPLAGRALDLVTHLSQAEQAAHDVAYSLMPMHKGQTELAAALDDLAYLMSQLYRRRCVFRSDNPVTLADPQIALHLYRIAQEAVGNAMKHGEPGEVRVSLSRNRHGVVLEIRDDGRGLPPENDRSSKSLGLDIMRYRARLIGAQLTLASKPGRGTTVRCERRRD